ncbi:MAG: flagellar export chaperone FliS [Spirochaetaceae bacterium]|nr:MAG: flagellar export chaperone FliS [Spirochaetaceae bacterium]
MGLRGNPVDAYKQTRVRTASQGRVIVMLYDEAIRQLDVAGQALAEGAHSYDRVNAAVSKTQQIITELMVSLDFDKGGAFAQNLLNLYMFFNRELTEANLKKKPEPIAKVRSFLAELRDAWDQAERTSSYDGSAGSSGINIAG